MSKKYYLGLDIGTNSVGWAVTDENYNLCKYAGKRMWGIRLFEGGETAEQRRISRSNRRRLSRKKQRIDLLQELFAEEIAKMDPTFFIRLNESRLHLEDKSTGEKFPLFTDKDYTDIQYYKEYPTMYHLRKELIENSKVHDVRLVYLACHHILKNRGHFLINGSFSDVKKLSSVCESMLNSFNGISKYQIEINDIERLEEILSDRKKQKSVKAKELIQIFECGPCEDKTDEKTCKAIVSNLSKWLTGLKGNINSIFDMQFEEIDTSSFSFTEPKYEDTISAALEEKYPDYADVIQKIKTVYDWSVLVEIMAGEDYLSFAKVNAYNKHKENLCILKEVIRKYCDSEMYHKFFNGFDEKNGYGNYIGSIYKNGHSYAMKKCSTEDFYKTLGKILDKIQPEKEDENVLEELKGAAEGFKTIVEFLAHVENVKEEIEKSKVVQDGVILSTIHGVKGMEFKNVFIIDCNEETIPHKSSMEDNLEEERRLFYVAITRAIKNLYVFSPKTIRGKFSDMSRFILESGLEEESSVVDYGIKTGDSVYHRQYGDGKVKSIEGDKITLDFKEEILRTFSLRVLMENNLIILIK